MTTPPTAPAPRRRRALGTRELVIAFAIVEAIVLLWLVTRTSRTTRRRAATPAAPAAAIDSTSRPAPHARP